MRPEPPSSLKEERTKRTRKKYERDPSFLYMAAVAGIGGLAAVVFAIGFPIWALHQGKPYTPAFSLFAAWGLAALAGSYACLQTYFLTDEPPTRPPRGGVRLEFRRPADSLSAPQPPQTSSRDRAA